VGKILVIDDDRETLELLRDILRGMTGTEVICESSSSRAVALIKENEFDLILSDIVMPELDGISIMEYTKHLWPDTEVILLSGLVDLDRTIDFIQKPLKIEKFRETVQNALEKRRLASENQKLTQKLGQQITQTREPWKEDIEGKKGTGGKKGIQQSEKTLKNAELDLKQQEAILNNMPSGYLILDRRGLISHINPTAENMLGLADFHSEAEKCLHNHKRLLELSEIVGGLSPEEPSSQKTICIHSQNETGKLIVKVRSSLVESPAGDGFMVLVLEDITEIKLLKKELQDKERLARVGKLTSSIAHELKNPLGAIRGLGEILSMKTAGVTKLQQLSDNIVSEVDRLNNIIGDIVMFSKDTAPTLQSGDFVTMVSNLVAELKQAHPETSIKLTVCDDVPKLLYDFANMSQALGNIIENAVLAIKEVVGGTVNVTVSTSEAIVKVLIEDNGIGMSEDALSKIFKPFFSTRKEQGSGLGMTLAEKIIKDHRGLISVSSTPAEGTKVLISLPQINTCTLELLI
jgi:nitrogen-specific signal transduction histidine kinase/CheY-like chemotaxis protein